jgi:uncharacterized protein with HEPN domain
MAKLKDIDYLHNIHLGFCRIKYYTENISEEQLLADIKTQDALAYCFQQIAKNAQNLSSSFKKQNELESQSDWVWLAMFDMEGFCGPEDYWEIIHDETQGLMKMYKHIRRIFNHGVEVADKTSGPSQKKVDDLPLTTNYKYPIHTRSSIWTVRKR